MKNFKGLVWLGVLVVFLGQAVPARADVGAAEVSLTQGEMELTYTVKPGDTLSGIAQTYGVQLDSLIAVNRLDSSLIYPNDLLMVPGHFEPVPAFVSRGYVDRSDLMLLARLIYAEARGEPFSGQVAVGAVIVNRMASPLFPGNIRAVIMQHQGRSYQFQPVADGSIGLTPDATAVRAAIAALNGQDPSRGALYFYNPALTRDPWIKSLPVVARIGNQVFATEKAAGRTFFAQAPAAGAVV